jgi:hypothetical protein
VYNWLSGGQVGPAHPDIGAFQAGSAVEVGLGTGLGDGAKDTDGHESDEQGHAGALHRARSGESGWDAK